MRLRRALTLISLLIPWSTLAYASSTIDCFLLGGGGGVASSSTFSIFGVFGQDLAGSSSSTTLMLEAGLLPRTGTNALVGTETITLPTATRLSGIAPNPFTRHTTISFDLDVSAPASVRVFDIHGRLVRLLVEAKLPPGRHSVDWDGTTSGSGRVAPGVYFCQFTAGAIRSTQRFVFVR